MEWTRRAVHCIAHSELSNRNVKKRNHVDRSDLSHTSGLPNKLGSMKIHQNLALFWPAASEGDTLRGHSLIFLLCVRIFGKEGKGGIHIPSLESVFK